MDAGAPERYLSRMDVVFPVAWGAAFLWAYALVLAVAWFRAVGREALESHVAHFVTLMGVMVPTVAVSVMIVLVAGTFGIPWLILLLAVTIPGGLVVSLQLEMSRLTEARLGVELLRLGAAAALTAAYGARALVG